MRRKKEKRKKRKNEGGGGGHTNLSGLVNVSRHDSNLALARLNDSWAVGSDQADALRS